MLDLIIIGAGPAGITSAVYAARKNMDVLIVAKDIGGQTAWSGDIENYTGYQFVTGPELVAKFEEHMHRYSITVKDKEEVIDIKKDNDICYVKTDKDGYEAKTVIIASGKSSKELGVTGEKEFKNKGLTYCATCDAPLFKGKNVAVIGGGNSALDATLQLMNIANYIYIINVAEELTGDPIMQKKVKDSDKVVVMNKTKVNAVFGNRVVTAIKIDREGKEETVAVQGIFVEIGLIPNSQFANEVEKNDKGEIMVNRYNQTNVSGIFAAGDVTDVPEKQIIIAAGEGAKATLSVFRYLARKEHAPLIRG